VSAEPFQVRRAVHGDESIVRALRLRAMADAPEAFGSTHERELTRTADDWQRWLSTGATFMATNANDPVGLVAGLHDAVDPAIVHLMSMWVDPAHRGHAVADTLVASLLSWARDDGARVVRLLVIDTNLGARRCYERNGFRPTGRQSVRERDGAAELEMEAG
jgi:ribosomal protein S18 acetylase RimI-like enzyme